MTRFGGRVPPLVAVAGIAIFHTLQWTFQAACTGLPEYAPLAVFPYSGALGFINLLGCWANEVFFMISGYFLIPSAALRWRYFCLLCCPSDYFPARALYEPKCDVIIFRVCLGPLFHTLYRPSPTRSLAYAQ